MLQVKTDEVDGETDFIEEIGGGSLFSDGSDDDYDSGSNENDDDDLLPLDDDLLNLEEWYPSRGGGLQSMNTNLTAHLLDFAICDIQFMKAH